MSLTVKDGPLVLYKLTGRTIELTVPLQTQMLRVPEVEAYLELMFGHRFHIDQVWVKD